MRVRAMTLLAVLLAGLAGFAGCQEATQEQRDGLSGVSIGDPMSRVTQLAGEPDSRQSFDRADPLGGAPVHTECWYYGIDVQVCFDERGRVESKNDY